MKYTLLFLSGIFFLIQTSFSQTFVDSRAEEKDAWKQYVVELFSDIKDYVPATTVINKYGSNTAYRSTGTGFFRVEKIDGRWFIIDPDGYVFIHKGVACVSPGTSDNQKAAVTQKWSTNDNWCTFANDWLKENGFNGAGAWSDVARLRKQTEPAVYTVIVNPMSNYRNYHRNQVGGYTNAGWQGYEYNIVRVFDPMFEVYMDNACKALAQYKDDKYLLGYFIDNELPWVNDALDRHIRYLSASDPCYIAAKNWLDERKGKNATLNDITPADRNAFWDFYAGKFFQMAKQYITKYDPNHMFLGSRFNQGREELVNPYIFETAGKYCDIISINHYREWEPIADRMVNWERWANKPFMITEFYTKGEDSGLLNATGAGWLVKTQHDRGLFYENFVIKLLRSKGCVGWHWFRYQDNDPEDLTTDPSNRDSNKGLVDVTYTPYADLMTICKQVNDNVYSFLEYLETVKEEEETILFPVVDTYVRLMASETTVHGAEDILRVKNSNGTTYERTAFIQFDFGAYSGLLPDITELKLRVKLMNIYPGVKDPSAVTMNLYRITNNLTVSETMSNTQLLSVYQSRQETLVGGVEIPVNDQSKNSFFEIDITGLLSLLNSQPIITLRLQMNVETETQFEFASREDLESSARPQVRIKQKAKEMSIDNQKQPMQVSVYRCGNQLIIDGVMLNSIVKFYNLTGMEVYRQKQTTEHQMSLNISANRGRLMLLNISGDQQNETIKIII